MDIKVEDIVRECNAKLVCGNNQIICGDFSKDTRLVKENDVYVGLKGESFDGNKLYEQALEKGAKVCILQDVEINEDIKNKYFDRAIIVVEDTIKALQQLAAYKRSLYNIPVVGITGSVGKTSARDMIASIVATKYKVWKTQGNYNNHLGLPLTILGLKDHEALVVEMGMNHSGEISLLSKIAKPDIAVITNVGTAHIGNLGSREGILKAKLEILDGLKKDGVLIINKDDDMLSSWYDKQENKDNILTFGIDSDGDIKATDIEIGERGSSFKINDKKFEVPVAGGHYIYHALLGILVGRELNISDEKIAEGIKSIELTKGRMEMIKCSDDIIVINDCYNANFDSMKAAVDYLGKVENRRKIAVLGDMLELGEFSEALHKKIGEEVSKNDIDILITVGELGKLINDTADNSSLKKYHFDNNEEAIKKIKSIMENKDIVLVKASNAMKFIEIVEAIKK